MKRVITFFAVIFFVLNSSISGFAEPKEISLNGIWKYTADPTGVGINNGYFKSDVDFSNWKDMKIPGNWAIENPDMFSYNGKVWFKKRFKADEELLNSNVARLRFEGVDYIAKAWLNDHYLGEHEGYFSPFDFEVKKYLKPESNVLTVCVDSPKEPNFGKKRLVKGILVNHDCRPPGNNGNTGGIWNDVKLIGTGGVYIKNVLVKSELNDDLSEAEVHFECLVDNPSPFKKEAGFKINFEGKNFSSDIAQLKKPIPIQPGESKVILSSLIKDPRLWWTWDHGKPNLYKANISVETDGSVSDTRELTFGIRKIEFDQENKFFYLNGKRMFQRGTNYIATQWLSTFNKEKFEKDIQMMVDANLNSVRNHAHVMPQEFYTVCEEKGLLVWADFALIWGCAEDEAFIKETTKQFKEYITGYYNHPSIWLWCAHNEGGDNRKLNRALYEAGGEIDSDRIISEDSGGWDKHPYHGWYGGRYEDYLNERAKFVTEYGAQGISSAFKGFIPEEAQWPPDTDVWGYHNLQFDFQERWIGGHLVYGSAEEFSEMSLKYQYDLVKFATEHFRRSKYKPVGGAYQFMFVECWPSITWAVVDYYRTPKPAYYALQECMSPVFVSIKWTERFFSPGETAQVSFWCINDYMYPINNCTLSYEITDVQGDISYQKDSVKLKLEKDSSKKIKDILFTIPSDAKPENIFKLSVKLEDPNGKILSTNRFVLRVKKENKFVKDLSGKWLFKKGDDPSYSKKDFNDANWREIYAPGKWEEQIGGYDGFAWYRKHITIPEIWSNKDIKLFIGSIDDSDEVYFNGERIGGGGSLPPNYKTAYNQNRLYLIPGEPIEFDKDNVIAVRVYDFTGDGGLVYGPIEIGDLQRKYIPVYLDYPKMKWGKILVFR